MRTKGNVLHPILKVILEGVYCDESPLLVLKGVPHIIRRLWEYIKFYNPFYWKSLIKLGFELPDPMYMSPFSYEKAINPILIGVPQNKFVMEAVKVNFPGPQNLNIHMMPFIMSRNFEDCYLPQYLYDYWKNFILPLFHSYNAHPIDEE